MAGVDDRTVAILNTNDDIVELLRAAIESAGLVAVSAHLDDVRRARISLEDFIHEHDPKVIVYDIAPPYDRNWRYLEKIRSTAMMSGRKFVVTTTNLARAKELGAASEHLFEIVGKPFDINQLVDVVREASRSRL